MFAKDSPLDEPAKSSSLLEIFINICYRYRLYYKLEMLWLHNANKHDNYSICSSTPESIEHIRINKLFLILFYI